MKPQLRFGSSVYLLRPLTEAGKQWAAENVHYEAYQQMGGGIVIEARYIAPIVDGMEAAGLVPDEDFEVTYG